MSKIFLLISDKCPKFYSEKINRKNHILWKKKHRMKNMYFSYGVSFFIRYDTSIFSILILNICDLCGLRSADMEKIN